MKLFKKLAILCLSLSMFTAFFVACNESDSTNSESSATSSLESSSLDSTSDSSSDSSSEEEKEETANFVYRIKVQNATGYGFKNVTVALMDGETEIASKKTSASGYATFEKSDIIALGNYNIVVNNIPTGYVLSQTDKPPQTLAVEGFQAYIQIEPAGVIMEPTPLGTSYALGDVMYDFTAKLPDGSYFTLSEELKTKDMVLINFWATWCAPCKSEFPAMNNAYVEYQDKIGLIATSTTDDMNGVANFKTQNSYLFNMTSDRESGANLTKYFPASAIPLSVIVDRYGVITFMHTGSMTSKSDFTARFEKFCGEDYQPTILIGTGDDQIGGGEETDLVKPTYDNPAISSLGFLDTTDSFEFAWDEEDEYAWPWLIDAENEESYIYAPITSIHYAYATLSATFQAKPGYTLLFDYIVNSETTDILYVLIDDVPVVRLYGSDATSLNWKTCTAYVFNEYEKEGEHTLTLIYSKDSDISIEGECVRVKNLRLEENTENAKGLIFRHAANNRNDAEDATTLYQDYATVVYSNTDGYYHVNTADGPILLANLMLSSPWSEQSIWNLAYIDYLVVDGYNLHQDIEDFAWEANQPIPGYLNLTYGYTPVTQELKTLLEYVVASEPVRTMGYKYFKGETHENEWLEVCAYYEAYNVEQLRDPMKTITFHAAEQVYEGKNTANVLFSMTPRGFKYKFIPERSGVYHVYSIGSTDTMCFLIAEDRTTFLGTYDEYLNAKPLADGTTNHNFEFYYYFEEGTTYYLLMATFDTGLVTSYDFCIDYFGETYSYMEYCAQGPESFNEVTYEFYLLGAKEYTYCEEDGYYHLLNKDGSMGEVLYVNMLYMNYFFTNGSSLKDVVDKAWDYEEEKRLFYLNGVDYTPILDDYVFLSQIEYDGDDIRYGYIPLDQELFNIFQLLFSSGKYESVADSWQLFCNYPVTLGNKTSN